MKRKVMIRRIMRSNPVWLSPRRVSPCRNQPAPRRVSNLVRAGVGRNARRRDFDRQPPEITPCAPDCAGRADGLRQDHGRRPCRQAAERAVQDADAEIVEAAGLTIPEIFEKHGEAEFRRGEERVIKRLLTEEPMILATGGGAFMSSATRAAIKAAGRRGLAARRSETLLERTGRRDTRPLLKNGDPREILSGLMAQRYPVYAEADIRVESTLSGSADDVAASIVAALEKHDAANPDKPFLKALA